MTEATFKQTLDGCPQCGLLLHTLNSDPHIYNAVFSLEYPRHVGPAGLHYRILFDVRNEDNPKALMWLQTPPTPRLPIMP